MKQNIRLKARIPNLGTTRGRREREETWENVSSRREYSDMKVGNTTAGRAKEFATEEEEAFGGRELIF